MSPYRRPTRRVISSTWRPCFVDANWGVQLDGVAESLFQVADVPELDLGTVLELGRHYEDNANYKRAAVMFRRALRVEPECAAALFHLGGLVQDEGKDADAEWLYRKAVLVRPDYVAAWYNLALLLEQTDITAAETM